MKFEKYEDAAGQWRWRIRARNGRIIADGSEGYTTEANVNRAIAKLKAFGARLGDAKTVVVGKARPVKGSKRGIAPAAVSVMLEALSGVKR